MAGSVSPSVAHGCPFEPNEEGRFGIVESAFRRDHRKII
jgi:hypothetical protein